MKKNEVVKSSLDFNNIIKEGSCLKNDYFFLYYLINSDGKAKYGIAVGKKVGNAVVRNKYKRKIRFIVDQNKNLFKKTYNYIIIMKKAALNVEFQQLHDSLKKLIEKVK